MKRALKPGESHTERDYVWEQHDGYFIEYRTELGRGRFNAQEHPGVFEFEVAEETPVLSGTTREGADSYVIGPDGQRMPYWRWYNECGAGRPPKERELT